MKNQTSQYGSYLIFDVLADGSSCFSLIALFGMSHIGNHSAPAFPFLNKGNTCFDFGKHGTGSKLVLFDVFLSVCYSDAAKLLLIYLTVVQTYVLYTCENKKSIGI